MGALVCHLLQHLLGGGQFLPMFLQRTFQVFDLLSLCFYLVGQDAHLQGDTGDLSRGGAPNYGAKGNTKHSRPAKRARLRPGVS